MIQKIIVTKHKNLVKHIKKLGLADEDTKTLMFAKPEDIKGKHVIGVLPMHVACYAEIITEVPLKVPFGQRGTELSLEDIEFYAGEPQTYRVEKIDLENEAL